MRFVITGVDYAPDDLHPQVPIRGRILRSLSVVGGSDHHLAELDDPLDWTKEGERKSVTHLVLGARWVGGAISASMRLAPVNICYVTDESILGDSTLDAKKCAFVAVGLADGEAEPNQ